MNKSQLVEALAKAENLTIKTAEDVVNTFFREMEKSLTSGSRIEVRGLGSFKIKRYDSYNGRNPKTGKIIKVDGKKLPFFKVGRELKERVDKFSTSLLSLGVLQRLEPGAYHAAGSILGFLPQAHCPSEITRVNSILGQGKRPAYHPGHGDALTASWPMAKGLPATRPFQFFPLGHAL